jgi:hypothetical protein
MTERDAFEARFHAAVRGYAGRVSSDLDPVELARRIAAQQPRRHEVAASLPWRGVTVPRLSWVLLLAGLLLALVVGSLAVGARRADHAVVIAPSPSPTPAASATTAPDEGTDILATTKARPLPAQATCPPGSDPDTPGPADQARPRQSFSHGHAMAFDRRAGRIVLYDPYSLPGTWTFDVCTNTWQQMHPDQEPLNAAVSPSAWLAYDADSDRTVALLGDRARVSVWSYDLAADRWTRGATPAWARQGVDALWEIGLVYDPVSGLVVLRDAAGEMWAYDVESDAWTQVRQGAVVPPLWRRSDGGGLAQREILGYDWSADRFVLWVENQPTWTFDARAGRWVQDPGPIVEVWYAWGGSGTASAYDEAAALTLFTSAGGPEYMPGVLAYDATRHTWEALWIGSPCLDGEPTYDAVNGRIVCWANASTDTSDRWTRAPRGMTAFDARARQWITLLEPVVATGKPNATLAP